MVNLTLISLIILGIMYVVAALIDRDKDSIDRIFRNETIFHPENKGIVQEFFPMNYRYFLLPAVLVQLCLVPRSVHVVTLHSIRFRSSLHHCWRPCHQANLFQVFITFNGFKKKL
jgi:hypothetical protein